MLSPFEVQAYNYRRTGVQPSVAQLEMVKDSMPPQPDGSEYTIEMLEVLYLEDAYYDSRHADHKRVRNEYKLINGYLN